MSRDELLVLFDYLDERGCSGATPMAVARDTGISSKAISAYLQAFPDLFLRVGDGPKVTINAFSEDAPITRSVVLDAYGERLLKLFVGGAFTLLLVSSLFLVLLISLRP